MRKTIINLVFKAKDLTKIKYQKINTSLSIVAGKTFCIIIV